MINISFFAGLWISFSLMAFASFFVFFAKRFDLIVLGGTLALSAITIQFLNIDISRSSYGGQIIAVALWFLFLSQIIVFKWCLTTNMKQVNPLLFGLPFLAFISMAISTNLLTFDLGLSLFGFAFLMLSALRKKSKEVLLIAIQKMMVAFLGYAYGMAILFSREGNIFFNDLYLKLNKGNWDNWTSLGIGLIALAILIEFYAVIPLIGKKNGKV